MLSIVTITYNDPKGLSETLQSLVSLHSKNINFEHIIVDSSPYLNSEVLESFKKGICGEWPLVHTVLEPNGVYSALNAGAKLATGEAIWFLNGGDRLRDDKVLEKILRTLDNNPEIEIVGAGWDLYRNKVLMYPKVPGPCFLNNLLGRNGLCQQALVYRLSALAKVGPFKEKFNIAGDYEHLWRCYQGGIQAQFIPDRLIIFDNDGVSGKFWRLSLLELRNLRLQLKKTLPPETYRRHLRALIIENLRVFFVKGVRKFPLSFLLKPVWLWWNRRKVKIIEMESNASSLDFKSSLKPVIRKV